jgi:hypothetical protein
LGLWNYRTARNHSRGDRKNSNGTLIFLALKLPRTLVYQYQKRTAIRFANVPFSFERLCGRSADTRRSRDASPPRYQERYTDDDGHDGRCEVRFRAPRQRDERVCIYPRATTPKVEVLSPEPRLRKRDHHEGDRAAEGLYGHVVRMPKRVPLAQCSTVLRSTRRAPKTGIEPSGGYFFSDAFTGA